MRRKGKRYGRIVGCVGQRGEWVRCVAGRVLENRRAAWRGTVASVGMVWMSRRKMFEEATRFLGQGRVVSERVWQIGLMSQSLLLLTTFVKTRGLSLSSRRAGALGEEKSREINDERVSRRVRLNLVLGLECAAVVPG